jgi:hypothetical protein
MAVVISSDKKFSLLALFHKSSCICRIIAMRHSYIVVPSLLVVQVETQVFALHLFSLEAVDH